MAPEIREGDLVTFRAPWLANHVKRSVAFGGTTLHADMVGIVMSVRTRTVYPSFRAQAHGHLVRDPQPRQETSYRVMWESTRIPNGTFDNFLPKSAVKLAR